MPFVWTCSVFWTLIFCLKSFVVCLNIVFNLYNSDQFVIGKSRRGWLDTDQVEYRLNFTEGGLERGYFSFLSPKFYYYNTTYIGWYWNVYWPIYLKYRKMSHTLTDICSCFNSIFIFLKYTNNHILVDMRKHISVDIITKRNTSWRSIYRSIYDR